MQANLNEKYLLKFISNANNGVGAQSSQLLDVINEMGIKLRYNDTNPVYDLIYKMEYSNYYE